MNKSKWDLPRPGPGTEAAERYASWNSGASTAQFVGVGLLTYWLIFAVLADRVTSHDIDCGEVLSKMD